MKKIILTIAAVLTLISCTPGENATVIDNSIEPVTNNDTSNDDPIPDPDPEPEPDPISMPFEGGWVLYGNYAPHCNCIQTPSSPTGNIVLDIDADTSTIVVEGVSYEWSYGTNFSDCTEYTLETNSFIRYIHYNIASEDCGNDFLPDDRYIYIQAYGDGFMLDGVFSRGYFILIKTK